jgi:hypothetical protein
MREAASVFQVNRFATKLQIFGLRNIFQSQSSMMGQSTVSPLCLSAYTGGNSVRGGCRTVDGCFGPFTRWAVVFLIIFVLFLLLVPYGGYGVGAVY